MSPRPLCSVLSVLALAYTTAAFAPEDSSAEAARAFLGSLDETQHEQATFRYDDAERLAWNFLPNVYQGVRIGDLTGLQAAHLDVLLAEHLSALGRGKLAGVRDLEDVLFELESRPDAPATNRDRNRYWVAVFGTPGEGAWGWRIQGHHLSYNFCVDVDGAASTPFFLGANPRVTEQLQLLEREEALARALLDSLDGEHRAAAVQDGAPPRDVLMGPGKDTPPPVAGLARSAMTQAQRAHLDALRTRVVEHLPPERRLDGSDAPHFLWIGPTAPGAPHYWRLQGARQVVEWCTPQGQAGHVHLVWRDLERDLGGALSATSDW